jgi:hypothetical protein
MSFGLNDGLCRQKDVTINKIFASAKVLTQKWKPVKLGCFPVECSKSFFERFLNEVQVEDYLKGLSRETNGLRTSNLLGSIPQVDSSRISRDIHHSWWKSTESHCHGAVRLPGPDPAQCIGCAITWHVRDCRECKYLKYCLCTSHLLSSSTPVECYWCSYSLFYFPQIS